MSYPRYARYAWAAVVVRGIGVNMVFTIRNHRWVNIPARRSDSTACDREYPRRS
jgi:hypothetical protein